MDKKTCSRCKLTRPLSMFHKKKTGIMGVNPACKLCISKDKHKHFQKKQEAKKRRKLSRYKSMNVGELEICVIPYPIPESEFRGTIAALTDAINQSYLNHMD